LNNYIFNQIFWQQKNQSGRFFAPLWVVINFGFQEVISSFLPELSFLEQPWSFLLLICVNQLIADTKFRVWCQLFYAYILCNFQTFVI